VIVTHNGHPVNGIDVAKYQSRVIDPLPLRPQWLSFFGVKATDTKKISEMGVDPQFGANREAGTMWNVRWRPIYLFVRNPTDWGTMAEQFSLYAQVVGELRPGECVMVDWENHDVTGAHIAELTRLIEIVYGSRWIMYVNDMTPDMVSWMEANVAAGSPVPIVHPNPYYIEEAIRFDAAVWQCGVASRTTCPEPFALYPNCDAIDVDFVLKPDVMDHVCRGGRC